MFKRFLLLPVISYIAYVCVLITRQDEKVLEILIKVYRMSRMEQSQADQQHIILILGVIGLAVVTGFRLICYPLAIALAFIVFQQIQFLFTSQIEVVDLSMTLKIISSEIFVMGLLLVSTKSHAEEELSQKPETNKVEEKVKQE